MKVKVIRANAHKYPISKMCACLKISRAGYYKYQEAISKIDDYNDGVVKIFNNNQKVYGTRKIKKELGKQNICLSRKWIVRIMRFNGLMSVYTTKKYRPLKSKVNDANISNEINQEFSNLNYME